MNPVKEVGTDELVRIYLKAKREVLDEASPKRSPGSLRPPGPQSHHGSS